ncbi:MAG: hypothetical protein PHX14_10255, partial [Syntrophomonadaceae bacterium]|nr:hypothetical protein [Syntrophomonadaceae bacterium]
GKLHVLGQAKAARESFLELDAKDMLAPKDIGTIYPDIKTGSNNTVEALSETVDYLPVAANRYVSLDTATRVLNSLALPEKALQGYGVFLMPYEFKGLGGYSFSSDLPHIDEAAFISAAHSSDMKEAMKAIAHETGHFLHHQYIGEYTGQNQLWQAYLDMRGQQWQKGEWEESTTENFAEDFRVTCGGLAADIPHSGNFGEPGPELKTALAGFFQKLNTNVQPLPVVFSNLSVVSSGATITQLNGLEPTASIILDGKQLQVKGVVDVRNPDYEAVLYLTGENYEKCWPLKNGTFASTIDLPGPGKYELLVGTEKNDTIVTCQLFKIRVLGP